jgi:hypothetical protein
MVMDWSLLVALSVAETWAMESDPRNPTVRRRNAHKLEVPRELVGVDEVGSRRDLSRKFSSANRITLALGMYGRGGLSGEAVVEAVVSRSGRHYTCRQ